MSVIWVFGEGATGKKTEMFSAANPQVRSKIRMVLNITRSRVIVPVVIPGGNDRKKIIKSIYDSNSPVIFLIHGQEEDYETILQDFKLGTVVYVTVNEKQFHDRRKKRGKASKPYSWYVEQIEWQIKTLKSIFKKVVKI